MEDGTEQDAQVKDQDDHSTIPAIDDSRNEADVASTKSGRSNIKVQIMLQELKLKELKLQAERERVESLLEDSEADPNINFLKTEEIEAEINSMIKAVTSNPTGYQPPPDAASEVLPKPILPSHNWALPAPAATSEALPMSMSYPQYPRNWKLPAPEPEVFGGDPLRYLQWKTNFDALMEGLSSTEKIMYLERYTKGPAKKVIEGLFLLGDGAAYEEARSLLEKRFGSSWHVAEAFRKRLAEWKRIDNRDPIALQEFADFLQSCKIAYSLYRTALGSWDDPFQQQEVLKKLPEWIIIKWTTVVHARKSTTLPSFKELAEFIAARASEANDPLTSLAVIRGSQVRAKEKFNESRKTITVHKTMSQGKETLCLFCENPSHSLNKCFKFRNLTLKERVDFVMKNNICFGCLVVGHQSRSCDSRLTCDHCQRKHPTVLHDEQFQRKERKVEAQTTEKKVTSLRAKSNMEKGTQKSQIVPIYIQKPGSPDIRILTYGILDNQSDSTFITEELANKLEAKGENMNLKIQTLNGQGSVRCRRISDLQIQGFAETDSLVIKEAFTTEQIPVNRQHIPTGDYTRAWPHLKSLQLPPLLPVEVGLLIGYDNPVALKPLKVIEGQVEEPFAVKTFLGWSVVGSGQRPDVTVCNRISSSVPAEDLRTIMEGDFHDGRQHETLSQEDLKFLKKMSESTERLPDGRLQFPLPRKEISLPNNRDQALKRLQNLQRKFRDEKYKTEYVKQVEIMIENGEAEKCDAESNLEEWYLPHHAVFKNDGKLRVVFDAAARYKSISLNDILLQGPDLINSLVGVMLRFRLENIALACDVKRMFYCFVVPPRQRSLLKFLWWPGGDATKTPENYRMTRHVFGAKSSPAVANYGLKMIAALSQDEQVQEFLTNSFYVDDGLVSVRTTGEAVNLIRATQQHCSQFGVELHKFVSNNPEVEKALHKPSQDESQARVKIQRVLGIEWDIINDSFQFRMKLTSKPVTRRNMLKTLASIFDPLGLLTPFVTRGKLLLQEAIIGCADWDQEVSDPLKAKWNRWLLMSQFLEEIVVERSYKRGLARSSLQLHTFSDASQAAYCGVSYIRAEDDAGNVQVTLAMAKGRVAPSRTIQTIPRLELQAASVATKVAGVVIGALSLPDHAHFYTDSRIVLCYLQNDARRFKVYVANRVSHIKEHTNPEQWHHVSSEENPADHGSRGMYPDEMVKCNWFRGPDFLWQSNYSPRERESPQDITADDPEIKKIATILKTTVTEESEILRIVERHSDWRRAVRVVAYLLKFVKKRFGKLTCDDLKIAEHVIFIEAQKTLKESSDLHVKKLSPEIDTSGLLRVGGRLRRCDMSAEEVHPIIIPKGTVAKLLVRKYHQDTAHTGRTMTMNAVRQAGLWIIGLGGIVKSEIHHCIICKQLRGKCQTQKMADLPKDRITPAPPFMHCGIDCFGPFTIRERRSDLKRYGMIATCLASRAVHLDILCDLSTDSLLQAIRRLVALRGPIKSIRCDRGTNLMGACNELQKREKSSSLQAQARDKCGIDFVFNTPQASHMGGVWERLIRTVRSILTPMLSQHSTRLTHEDLQTLFCECANIVNSRPISAESLSDHQVRPLTPNDLLHLRAAEDGPVGDFSNEVYGRKRWAKVQDLASRFWSRWMKEYLQMMQTRSKWQVDHPNLQIGDVVMLKEANPFERKFKLARVTNVFPSEDGKVRSIEVQLGDRTILRRPIHKVVLLVPKM